MKKKLIATAVAGALALPAVTVAEEHTTFRVYARINNAIDYTNPEVGDSQWGFRNVVSRWGIQGSSDLGNGLTAVGRYEFFTFTNREGNLGNVATGAPTGTTANSRGGIQDTRLGFVGLTGGFGSVTIGNQWSAWFNTVGTMIDPTFSLATAGYVTGYYRTSNTIKYSNTFGPVYLDLDVRMSNTGANADNEALGNNNGEDIDGSGLGLSFNVGENFTIAGAYDNDKRQNADDVEAWGVAGKAQFGNWGATLYWNEIDVGGANGKTSGPGFWVSGGFGKTSVLFGYGKADADNPNPDVDSFTLGIYHNMGAGFRVYFEGISTDSDAPGGDSDTALFGMRYDFSS